MKLKNVVAPVSYTHLDVYKRQKINNAASDMGTTAQIAQSFVSDGVDLICAIATPSAQAAYNAAIDSEIPVIYTAVTNPEEAELADENGMPVGAVTGTSDQLPVCLLYTSRCV